MKTIHKLLALALCLALLCSAAAAAMQETGSAGMKLADEVSYTRTGWSNDQKAGQYLQENYLTYTAGGEVRPMVVFGSTLYGRSPMNYTAKYLDDLGLRMVAGVNGSFFDMNTGIPYGLIVTEGVLRSSGSIASIGFLPNGKTLIGTPELHVTLDLGDMEREIFYNKALTRDNGVGLYSNDYDTATKSTVKAYNVILQPESGRAELTMRGTVTAKVLSAQASTASCQIPDGCFVLAIAEDSRYTDALSAVQSLAVGDTVTVTTDCDAAWAGVDSACGGGDMLVENGTAATEFTLDTADKPRARTAAGLKADGTLILYTADESETSVGLTLRHLAERMVKLGCVTAINLDGGGSTAAGVTYPGYTAGATVNSPSDGKLRGCANFIFLTRPVSAAAQAQRLHLYPMAGTAVLAGAKVTLTPKATGAAYQPAELPGEVRYTTNGGTVDGSVLTVSAPDQRDLYRSDRGERNLRAPRGGGRGADHAAPAGRHVRRSDGGGRLVRQQRARLGCELQLEAERRARQRHGGRRFHGGGRGKAHRGHADRLLRRDEDRNPGHGQPGQSVCRRARPLGRADDQQPLL